MTNVDGLVFRHTPTPAAFSTTNQSEETKQEEAPTVLYRGKQCTKIDIEDLMKKLEKRKPKEPEPEDCCGDGCNPCVFDTYDLKMDRYEDQKTDFESLLLEFEDELP